MSSYSEYTPSGYPNINNSQCLNPQDINSQKEKINPIQNINDQPQQYIPMQNIITQQGQIGYIYPQQAILYPSTPNIYPISVSGPTPLVVNVLDPIKLNGNNHRIDRCDIFLMFLLNFFLPGIGTIIIGGFYGGEDSKKHVRYGILQFITSCIVIGWFWAIIYPFTLKQKNS